MTDWMKRRKRAIRALIAAAKDEPCQDCGMSYPSYVMDLDHRPDEKKCFNIAAYNDYTSSLDKVQHEIDKCDNVCSNCHRQRTHERS